MPEFYAGELRKGQPVKHENTDVHSRVWPSLQTTDGHTLHLAPGETGDIAVREPILDDPYLRPVDTKRRGRKADEAATEPPADTAGTEQPAEPNEGTPSKEDSR